VTNVKMTPSKAQAEVPRILFFGDPHGDFEPVIEATLRLRPEAIVLLGDLQARRPLHFELEAIRSMTAVWFVHGNHDTDSESDYDNLWGSELADRNFHGRVVDIAGFKVAGLGGVFRGKVWDPVVPFQDAPFASPEAMLARAEARRWKESYGLWRGGLQLRHRSTIFPVDYVRLLKQRAHILVTHEAPGAHTHGFQALDELATSLGVSLLVHGHKHRDIDYEAEALTPRETQVRMFGVDKGSYLVWPSAPGESAIQRSSTEHVRVRSGDTGPKT
jgi:predicted phosphodiesterase